MAGKRANDRNPFRPVRLIEARFRYDQAGKQCPMGMSFWGKGVNPS